MSREFSPTQASFFFAPPKLRKLDRLRQGILPDAWRGTCTVYLLHFHRPIGNLKNRHGTARHYVGIVRSADPYALKKRLWQHRKGYLNASKITRALFQQGIGFHVGHVWRGVAPEFERVIKDWKNHKAFCEICQDVPFFDYFPLYMGKERIA
jgi:predicted GIY-YIG superfamily endonuclease